MHLDWALTSMTEMMMLPTSVRIWQRVFWSSVFLRRFVFINCFPFASYFHSCSVFFLSPLFFFCTVAGWHGRVNVLKEITLDGLYREEKQNKTIHWNVLPLRAKKTNITVASVTLDVITLTCGVRVRSYVVLRKRFNQSRCAVLILLLLRISSKLFEYDSKQQLFFI